MLVLVYLEEGTIFYAISKGFISVTPLTINMTNKTIYEKVKKTL